MRRCASRSAGKPWSTCGPAPPTRTVHEAWHSDTIVNLFSCTKTFTAVTALQLVAEGKLQLDAPVADYWPEFAAAGKEAITLRQLLCHQAGLPAIREMLPTEALYDWSIDGRHLWPPKRRGGRRAKATATRRSPMAGWSANCCAVPTGVGRASPSWRGLHARWGLDFHVGLADEEFYRVAHVARGKGNMGDAAAQRLLQVMMREPTAMTTRAFANPPSILTSTNKPEWRRMQQPAANGHGNARSLAGFYSGLLDGSLLESDMLEQLTREHSIGPDKTLLTQTRFGLGCMLDQPQLPNATFGLGPRAFGHPGAGGSVGFADPEHDVAFGFVTNTLGPYVLMDPRAQKLVGILAGCL